MSPIKKLLRLLLIIPLVLTAITVTTQKAHADYPAPSYSLNDQTSSDNDNNLTNYGTSSVSTNLPYTGDAYATQFQQSNNDKLTAASSSSLSPSGPMTIESWVKFNSLPSNTSGSVEMFAAKYNDASNQRQYWFGLYAAGGTYYLRSVYSTDGTYQGGNDVETQWVPSTGTWYHVAVVLDTSGPNVKFYVNGTQQGSTLTTSGTSIYSGTAPLYLGAVQTSGGDTFFLDGYLDDVRIWNTARSSTDISNNMDSALTGSESGLVAYYPFEQASFDLTDKTNNGNNLTNYGSTDKVTAVSMALPFSGDLRAAQFESSENDKLTAANSSSLNPSGSMTLETWVKFESLPSSGSLMDLISKFYDTGDQRSYAFGLENSSGGAYKLRFRYSTDGTYQGANDVSTSWTPSTGVWYHVAVVLDTATPSVTFYVNGSQQGSTITSNTGTSIYNSTTDLYLGATKTSIGDTFFLDGMLDDVRIWNTARTGTQINDNKSTALTGSESGLVAYYPFDNPLLQNKITYFNANDGTNFKRNTTPFTTGVATQAINSDGSVTVSVNNATGYADSGFDLYEGTLGNLPDFTVNGTGDQYSLNIWLDTSSNNEFFAWDTNGVMTGLGGDTYALGPTSSSGSDAIAGSSQFYLMSDAQNHTLSDLRNGNVSGISTSTKVAVWVGVNTSSGSTSASIQSIQGL